MTAELEAASAVLEVVATGDPGAADHVLAPDERMDPTLLTQLGL